MRAGVIGGGLAGLVAARDLAAAGATVTLFEPAAELGGQIRTRREAGFVVEDGAEGWVAADTDVPELLTALRMEDDVVFQLQRRSLLYSAGHLTDLQSGSAARLLGIQAADSDLGRGIASLRRGMGSLIDALVAALASGRAVLSKSEIVSLAPKAGGWTVTDRAGTNTAVDALVLAAPPAVTANLIDPLDAPAARALRDIPMSSSVSVSLGYEREAVGHPLDASGFVVDGRENYEGLRACAFSSSKLPARAEANRVLLRAFFRPEPADLRDGDDVWSKRAHRLLAPILQTAGQPVKWWVARWRDALPQFNPSHAEMIRDAASRLQQHGPVQLAGTHIASGGVPGAVRSGHAAAAALAVR